MIQRGLVSPNQALCLSIALFLSTLVIALGSGLGLFVIVAFSIVIAVTYSAPPVRWKNRGIWGCAVQGFAYGFITFNTGWYLATGRFDLYPVVVGLLLGTLIVGYGSTADLADRETDEENGIKTLPVVLGPRKASVFCVASMGTPYLVYLAMCATGMLTFHKITFLGLMATTTFVAYRILRNQTSKSFSQVHMIGVVLESIAPFLFIGNALL